MRKFGLAITLCLVLGSGLGFVLHGRGQPPEAAAGRGAPVRIVPGAMAFRILLGRKDTVRTAWDGSLAVTDGALLRLEGWRFRQQDKIIGPDSWKAFTRRAAARAGAAARAAAQPLLPNGVVAVLKTTPQTDVKVTTLHGEFHFTPSQIVPGKLTPFLDGAASVERVLADFPVTAAPTEDDFPAAATAPDGTVWIAYVAYRYGQQNLPFTRNLTAEPNSFAFLRPTGNGDQVKLARLTAQGDEAVWQDVADVTDPGQDVYRPAVAVDADGNVWVVWSQNVRDNWDLYARRYHAGTPGPVQRLTETPEPDLCPALASDDKGKVWLAWQGFRNGQSDIFLSSLPSGGDRWSEPQRVSDSPRNDWEPAIACAHDGSVWVAWDTYDKGDYDVRMRALREDRLSDVIRVTDSPRFEARANLVCDRQNRVWVAWEEAPPGWGKDFGYYVQNQGIPLYRGHTVAVRCYVDGKPFHTAGALADVLPGRPGPRAGAGAGTLGQAARRGAAMEASFPRLGVDGAGRVYLTYRQALPQLQVPTGTTWLSFVTWYEGAAWSPALPMIDSDSLLDNRPFLVTGPGRALFMVHSADGRNHAAPGNPRSGIYVTPLNIAQGAPAPPAVAAEEPPPARGEVAEAAQEQADIARMRAFRTRIGGKSYQILRGDFHRHTEISPDGGGDGPLIDMFRYAIDAAGHDWICAGDHDYGAGREYTWWQIQKLDDAFHLGANFVPIFGYERSVVYPNGHRNVMFVQRGIRALPRLSAGVGRGVAAGDTKMLYHYLNEFDGICASHTSATDMGTDWRDNDPIREPVVEIYQGDRQNYEYQGAPRSNAPGNSAGGFEPAGYVWNAFTKGYRFGFEASSDHISTHISYGMAYAEQPTRQAIFDAFRKRHTYGATDNILLEVRSGDHLMGDEFDTREQPRLQIRATGTKPVARVVVVKDNKVVYTATPGKIDVDLTWMDNDAHAGTSYYYVRLEQEDGQIAWASPMWIHYMP